MGCALHDREGSREADISASRELFHYIVKAALRAALVRFDNRPPGRRKRPYRGWGKWPRKPPRKSPRKPPRRRDGEAPFTHQNADNAFTE